MMTIANIQKPNNLPQAGVSPLAMVYAPAAEDSYKTIPLTRDKVAIVDSKDYEWLSRWKWCTVKDGNAYYAVRAIYLGGGRKHREYRKIWMHREILQVPTEMQTDHVDHNGLNNRRNNLRIVTCAENHYNQQTRATKSSKYKGFSWRKDRRKWQAAIRFKGQRIHLGPFNSETGAAKAYDKAAKKYFGERAHLNFPN